MPGQKFGPAWFPGLVAVGLGLCGVMLIASGARARGALVAFPDWIHRPTPRRSVGAVLGGLLAYILFADSLGFHLAGLALVSLWIRALGGSWRVAIAVGVIGTVVIHLAFYKVLRVPLPWGVLERWAF
jgi:putative tricarboxylic transport membrane protein